MIVQDLENDFPTRKMWREIWAAHSFLFRAWWRLHEGVEIS